MDTRRGRASTTVEPPPSWGGSFFKKPVSPSSSSSPSSPPSLSLGSRTTSMATMRSSPASDPQHRRAPSLATSLDASVPPTTSSLKSFSATHNHPSSHVSAHISVSNSTSSPSLSTAPSPRSTLPASAFAKNNLQVPGTNNNNNNNNSKSPTSKAKGFTQTIVDFIKSPRGGTSKPPTSGAPSPYLNLNTNMEKAIFGVELEVAVQRSNHIHELLPDVVYKCFVYLQEKAPQEEGIFRLTGSVTDIKKIRDTFDDGRDYDINTCLNPHTVAGILKLFIRESPQRLIPTTWAWSESRPLQELHDMIKQLAPPNRCFLSCLIKLLCIIIQASDVTKMGVANVVIVFSAALQCTASFLTHVINYAKELFPVDELSQTRERMDVEKKVAEEKDRAEKERAQKERAEKDRIEKDTAERIEKEKIERERAEKEKAENEREEYERAERKRAMEDKAEKERDTEKQDDGRSDDGEEKDEGHTTNERKRGENNIIHTLRAKKKHREHKKKEKREAKDYTKARTKDEDKQDKASGPLFDNGEEEKDNVWMSHMEQYEKGEQERRRNKERKEIASNNQAKEIKKGSSESIEIANESQKENIDANKDKIVEKAEEQKRLTVEVKNDDGGDMFKEEKDKEWEPEIETKGEKTKVKKRIQTIFDSDDE